MLGDQIARTVAQTHYERARTFVALYVSVRQTLVMEHALHGLGESFRRHAEEIGAGLNDFVLRKRIVVSRCWKGRGHKADRRHGGKNETRNNNDSPPQKPIRTGTRLSLGCLAPQAQGWAQREERR